MVLRFVYEALAEQSAEEAYYNDYRPQRLAAPRSRHGAHLCASGLSDEGL